MSRPAIECTCGHALSSHRPDPNDPTIEQRCHCGCAAFDNVEDAKMQNRDEDETDD